MRPEDVPTARFRGRTHRLIASRWPTIGVFDTVASPEDLQDALLIESLTNDRITETLARLSRIDRREWVLDQPGATLVMAAFCHPAPGGGRFNTDALGAWYCAAEIETAIAETVYHHARRLAHSASGFRHTIQMRELICELNSDFHDVRGPAATLPDLYDPDDYTASQAFGEALRRSESNGLLYDSVRRTRGRNIVVFRPSLLPPVRQGDHFDYRWAGHPEPDIVRVTNVGTGLS